MATAETVGTESRVGKRPVVLPEGVTVKFNGQTAVVKGPKGELSRTLPEHLDFDIKDNVLTVKIGAGAGRQGKQFQGLARALLQTMVTGTKDGYKLSLDLVGVGYRAVLKGQELRMQLGLSHPVDFTLPDSVQASVETIDDGGLKKPRLHLSSYDKQVLGQVAARIRSFRPPEPYKGKGVRYTGERIREKAGKAGKK